MCAVVSSVRFPSASFLPMLAAIAAWATLTSPVSTRAETNAGPAVLEFAIGLPGLQAQLSWASVPGIRYRIEKAESLTGEWLRVALFDASDVVSEWLDPVATVTAAFYRVLNPQPEVFSVEPTLLPYTGGTVTLHGQCIPAGSSLELEIEGMGLVSAPLVNIGPNLWQAVFAGPFIPGGAVISSAVNHGGTLYPIDITLVTGPSLRTVFSPSASLPPGAPVPSYQSNPIPGVGIVVKRNPKKNYARTVGPDLPDGEDEDCDGDTDDDRYAQSNPLYTEIIGEATNPLHGERIAPARSGRPGEVAIECSTVHLRTPAGPPIDGLLSYHSMSSSDAGFGPGWDFAYNIYIEAASTNAAQVVVHDGGGRSDVFHRRTDGTYATDGFFRAGQFNGGSFTLTFANSGTWTFHPLDGSPLAGKLHTITDPNGVALTCAYDGAGKLESISSAFGQSILLSWSGGQVASLTDHTGRLVTLGYVGGDLASVSAPQEFGLPPVAGDTTFTYSNGTGDPELDHNLLSVTDGSGQLLEAFAYASTTNPADIAYDTCATHNRHGPGHNLGMSHDGPDASGLRIVYENDELGRVTETTFDTLNRPVSVREYTGFATSGIPVTATSNRPSGKLRPGRDPDYFETTYEYNADSSVTKVVWPDGTKLLTTYERDLNPGCPVRERGNPRVMTLVSSFGESRTISMEHLPGFGTPESNRPGNPIGGLTIKGGRNPGGNIQASARPGNPIGGLTIKGGRNPSPASLSAMSGTVKAKSLNSSVPFEAETSLVWSPRSNIGDDDSNGFVRKGWDGTVKGSGIIGNDPDIAARPGNPIGGLTIKGGQNPKPHKREVEEKERGITINTSHVEYKTVSARPGNPIGGLNVKGGRNPGGSYLTRLTTSHGQTFTWAYDTNGNCTASIIELPLRGTLYQYDSLGRLSSITVTNGPGSSFQDALSYGGDGYAESFIRDSVFGGENLETIFYRDALGRIEVAVDPEGGDRVYTYNALDRLVREESPLLGSSRVATDYIYDAAGRLVRSDHEHRDADGNLDPVNPAYSTFNVYDARGRLEMVASEERPVDASVTLDPSSVGLSNFSVRIFGYDAAGQAVSSTTPAICRDQATDAVQEISYDERGLIHRIHRGDGIGPAALTTEYDYDSLGALVRCATLAPDSPPTSYTYDGFHRMASITDPMGNVASFEYDNAGRVTTSIFGETNDVPGSAGNVLLFRRRSHLRETVESDWDSAAFHAVFAQNDTIEEERFAPGAAGPHPVETTVFERSPAGLLQAVKRNGDTLLTYAYDSAGRVVSTSNGLTSFNYDLNGRGEVRVSTRTDYFGGGSLLSPKTYTYVFDRDARGRPTAVTGGGIQHTFAWDSLNRMTSHARPDRPSLTYAYDGNSAAGPYSVETSCDIDNTGVSQEIGRYLIRSGVPVRFDSANGYSTFCTADALDRRIRLDHPDGTYETATYDARGFLEEQRHRDGSVRLRVTDALGRTTLASWSSVPAGVLPAPDIVSANDGLGRLVITLQGSSSVLSTWDSLGNQTAETTDGLTVARTFNHRGRTGIAYPDGTAFAETRNKLGQLTAITALDGSGTTVAQIDYAGHRPWRIGQANGVVTEHLYRSDTDVPTPGDFSFDECIRVTSMAGGSLLTDSVIERTPDQRVAKRTTFFAAGATAPFRSREYLLDGLGRTTGCITEVREIAGGPVFTESSVAYTLDAAGRRLLAVGGDNPGPYSQDPTIPPGDAQMSQYSSWPGGPLVWDDHTNLVSFASVSGTNALVYDADGRLRSSNTTAYEYDALGRLLWRTDFSGGLAAASSFVYDGFHTVQELDDDGGSGVISAALTFATGDGGLKHCISTRNGTYLYPHGSTARASSAPSPAFVPNVPGNYVIELTVVDSTGFVIERYDQDDGGLPIPLDAAGFPSGSAVGPLRWMAPESLWDPSVNLFLGTGETYSPELGMPISSHKEKQKEKKTTTSKKEFKGHVTLLK